MKCDDHLRAFIAIDISTIIREKITRFQKHMSEVGAHASWIKPINIHLTLTFLGDIPVQSLEIISDIMDDVSALHKSFTCEIKGVGYFGKGKSTRIIWIGFAGDLQGLVSVQMDLFRRIMTTGVHLDNKPFVPHLTIARINPRHHASNIVSLLQPYKENLFGNLSVKDLILYRSELGPNGPSYTEMHRSPLRL